MSPFAKKDQRKYFWPLNRGHGITYKYKRRRSNHRIGREEDDTTFEKVVEAENGSKIDTTVLWRMSVRRY